MIRRLMLANVLLLALIGLLGFELRQKMDETKRREDEFLKRRIADAEVRPPLPLGKVPALDATAYQDAVSKNLFSKDRNPAPIPDPPPAPAPPPPVPSFPLAYGVMIWDGLPPTIVMRASKSSADQRGYHVGEKVGEWKIVSLDTQFVVLEWDGKQFKKRLDELMDRNPIQMAEAAPAQTAAAAPAPKPPTNLADKNGFGADMGGGYRACAADDKTPVGTVVSGMKKVDVRTPFGSSCHWEPAQ